MPPRLPVLAGLGRAAPTPAPLASFLLPFLQARNASILSSLSDNPGAYNRRIRVGRGPSSGKGKTSGRGHKGQKQHGKVPARFQGGQTPLYIAHGVKGEKNPFSVEMSPVNLDRIQSWIDQGRIDPSKPITVKELVKSRCIHGVKDGVKLLARGKEELKTPINILVSRASSEAISAVEAAGGKITTRYYTKESIKRILRGESDASSEASFKPLSYAQGAVESPILAATAESATPFTYRLPDPASRKEIEYYRDPEHRGYLSHLVEEGRGPSLFFKIPTPIRKKAKKGGATGGGAENKIW